MTCLIVDDDGDALFIAGKMLMSSFDFRIKTAKTAEEGIRFCKKIQMPDLIVLDWNLPELSGIEFLHKLRPIVESKGESVKPPKVIMCTGESRPEMVKKALESGAHGYLVKPYTNDDVVKQVEGLGFKRKTFDFPAGL